MNEKKSSVQKNLQDFSPIKILKRIAWPMGAWPFGHNLFSIFRAFIVLLIQMSLIASVTKEITLGCSNADEVIDLIVWAQCAIIASVKVILIRFHHKNVSQTIMSINEDWSTIKEPTLLDIMKSYATFGNFVCNAQLIFSCSELFLLMAKNLLSVWQNNAISNSSEILYDRPLPQGTKCLFMNASMTSYIFIYIFQMIQCIITSVGNVGMDVFFFLLAMHICGQLEILCQEIRNIHGENFMAIKTQIVALSQRHQQLLDQATDLEETFSSIILLQLAINVTAIALFGISVLVTLRKNGFIAALKPMTAIQVLMIQLFLYCYAGDLLTSRVQMIAFASYQSLWFEFPRTLSKDVYFIMMKAGKPFVLSAGKLLPINMKTFSSILKLSASYFSVFRLMLDARYMTQE